MSGYAWFKTFKPFKPFKTLTCVLPRVAGKEQEVLERLKLFELTNGSTGRGPLPATGEASASVVPP
jgi:hypothetical protein